ncbi:MAG: hypothetical protein ACI82F_004198, partial [Planctomycetota bacterium]
KRVVGTFLPDSATQMGGLGPRLSFPGFTDSAHCFEWPARAGRAVAGQL